MTSSRSFLLICTVGIFCFISYNMVRMPVLALFAEHLGAGPERIGECDQSAAEARDRISSLDHATPSHRVFVNVNRTESHGTGRSPAVVLLSLLTLPGLKKLPRFLPPLVKDIKSHQANDDRKQCQTARSPAPRA